MVAVTPQWIQLLGGFPFATDRRHNGAILFQLGKGFVNLFAIGTQSLGHISGRNRFASLAHGLKNFFFHNGEGVFTLG